MDYVEETSPLKFKFSGSSDVRYSGPGEEKNGFPSFEINTIEGKDFYFINGAEVTKETYDYIKTYFY